MQWNLLLTLWRIRRPYDSNDVRSFSRTLFPCSALGKPQATSQAMAQPEKVDQTRSQYASKVMKSGCALDGHLALEQLSSYQFQCTQDKRNLLARMLHLQKAEGNPLQVDTSSQIFRKQRVCEKIRLFDREMSKSTMQKLTSSQIEFF